MLDTAPTAPAPALVLDLVSDLGPAYSPTTRARVEELAALDTRARRDAAAVAAEQRRADLELYADLVAERYNLGHRPNVRRLMLEDELYTTLSLLAVA